MAQEFEKLADILADDIIKQAAPTKLKNMWGKVKHLHSGEAKKKALSEAEKAEATFNVFNKKVGDNPRFTATMNELRDNATKAKKNALRIKHQTTAIKAAPFLASGTAGGIIADEVGNKGK